MCRHRLDRAAKLKAIAAMSARTGQYDGDSFSVTIRAFLDAVHTATA